MNLKRRVRIAATAIFVVTLSLVPPPSGGFLLRAQNAPSIGSGQIVSGADYAAVPLAPGSIATAFGTFPVASTAQAQSFQLPVTLSGLSITIGSLPAPLFYVSAGQVNFQVPWELAGKTQAAFIESVNGVTGVTQTLNLAPVSPGIFSTNMQGSGQGAVLDSSYRIVGAGNPGTPGSTVIQIYATGLGPVSVVPISGGPGPLNPLATTTMTPIVSIGYVQAPVLFSGLAPGFSGLYQVDALVPSDAPTSTAVPVFLTIGGATSNTVTIAIGPGPVSPPPIGQIPLITSLSPAFGAAGTPSQQVIITGSTFNPGSTVTFNGMAHPATFTDFDHLTITLTASDLAKAGASPVVVDNPEPGGEFSNTVQFIVESGFAVGGTGSAGWEDFAHDAQKTGLSLNQSQPLNRIRWQTPVDLSPQFSGSELLIHYGSPLVTPGDTVIVPVKTGATGGFRVDARNSGDGSLLWSMTTDYVLPAHDWTPEFAPAMTPAPRVYFPGAGGTVYFRDSPDSPTGNSGQMAFYGLANYQANQAAYNSAVMINTPIISDPLGNIYFGFIVTGSTPLGLQGGIARISSTGQGTWVSAAVASGDSTMVGMVQNCAPALNWSLGMLYVAVSNGSTGYLLALNSTTLAPLASATLTDPISGQLASLDNDGTASPAVGTDGDVYYGVLENPSGENHYRGWLLHFDSSLSQSKIPGAFGWDDTPSLVPSFMVPSYTGTSSYLLMTKYNDYADAGDSGKNQIAILDPNATEPYIVARQATVTSTHAMNEVLTILGPTPNPPLAGVKEWCINSAAVDPATQSVLANSEDGKLYRWNLNSNTFTQSIVLTPGLGEAYTPTLIGADGTVYAINNATLFAIGQ